MDFRSFGMFLYASPGPASLAGPRRWNRAVAMEKSRWIRSPGTKEHRSSWVNDTDATTTPRSEMMVHTDNYPTMVFISRL
jgi:hypothetical protein